MKGKRSKADLVPVVGGALKANTYALMRRCVGDGVIMGHAHAYKHGDKAPGADESARVIEQIQDYVMTEICEWFSFEDAPADDGGCTCDPRVCH